MGSNPQLKVKAVKCYLKNGYLYTNKQIISNPYVGTLGMRIYKFLLMIGA